MVVYFSPHAKSESPGREAYPLLHGYNPLLTGNPATVWADHNGVRAPPKAHTRMTPTPLGAPCEPSRAPLLRAADLEMWKWRWLRGTWRANCSHLDRLAGQQGYDELRAACRPGWRFHFKGSWRVMGMGCTKTKDLFDVSPKDIWGDPFFTEKEEEEEQ